VETVLLELEQQLSIENLSFSIEISSLHFRLADNKYLLRNSIYYLEKFLFRVPCEETNLRIALLASVQRKIF
jgi:hypothetical protein